jgi:hypothetical protein
MATIGASTMTVQYILTNGDTLFVSRERPMPPSLNVGATLHTLDDMDYCWDGSVWVRIALPRQNPQP